MNRHIFMIVLLIGVGCSIRTIGGPLQIGVAENGREVDLCQGQVLIVKLEANPTTGYQWVLVEGGRGILKQEGAPVYTGYPHAPMIVGAGGFETWRFQGAQPGREVLRFESRRPWEKDKPPDRVILFNVVVR